MFRSVLALMGKGHDSEADASRRGPRRQRRSSYSPQVEALEARTLLSIAPISSSDAYTTREDATLVVGASTGVLANDRAFGGKSLTAVLVSGPAHGTLTLNREGSFTYLPTANYSGTDTFTYRASDGTKTSRAATVTLTVSPVNDAPVAVADVYEADAGSTLVVATGGVLANDTDADGDPLRAILVTGPSHGTLTLNTDGTFTYTASAGFSGNVVFSYKAQDTAGAAGVATVTLTVKAVYDFSAVSARLQESVTSGSLDGIGLIIVNGSKVLYQDAFGNQTLNSQEFIASASKLTTATVMMTLVDDGLIALDDPVAKYLPQFTTSVGAITIRQLLSQTHGLPGNHWTLNAPGQDNGLTLQQSIDYIAADFNSGKLQPVRQPGTEFDYSPGISYQILGRIAEVVTGQSWNELWQARVGSPLQMTGTTYGATANPRLAGGMASTLADYGRLVQIFLNGGTTPDGVRILSQAAVAEMLKNQVAGLPFNGSKAMPTEGYGLSWWHNEMNTVVSVPGAYGAIPWVDFAHGYAAFLLTYDVLAGSVPVWEDLLPLIAAQLSTLPQQGAVGSAEATDATPARLDAAIITMLAGPAGIAQTPVVSKPEPGDMQSRRSVYAVDAAAPGSATWDAPQRSAASAGYLADRLAPDIRSAMSTDVAAVNANPLEPGTTRARHG